jgi:CheY-like chemotaxis protein
VLVVDDVEDMRSIYAEYLQHRGFQALVASDAEAAKTMAVERHPDVIVMDYSLSGSDGLTATRQLKQDVRTAGIPIIILTGHLILASVSPAAVSQAGANTLAIKPCLPDVLEAEICRLLAGGRDFRCVPDVQ